MTKLKLATGLCVCVFNSRQHKNKTKTAEAISSLQDKIQKYYNHTAASIFVSSMPLVCLKSMHPPWQDTHLKHKL